MKININTKEPKSCIFSDIKILDVFKYKDEYYIKTNYTDCSDNARNLVGKYPITLGGHMVQPVESTLTIED